MPFKEADPGEEYKKNKDLRKEDVTALREWADKQPHLPQLTGKLMFAYSLVK